tara:strand:+ start:728 stop:1033 length:306 start_codon:yes stop_codon:yes gene_type:complete
MLSEELETLRHLFDSARLGEIQILPDGAAQISRFLERAESEVRRLEAFAASTSGKASEAVVPEETRPSHAEPPTGLGDNVVLLVPRASRRAPSPPEPGGAA